MPAFRTILCAADFSESSLAAFRLACSLGVEQKTRIIVLHVAEPNWVAEAPVYSGQQTIPFIVTERDVNEFTELERRLRATYVPAHPLDVVYAVNEGKAADEILRAADALRCDLIVMGTHGRKGIEKLLYGSVAEAVLRGAHSTVLVRSAFGRPTESEQIRAILCPTDFSDASDEALRIARLVARDHGARLVVMTAAPIDVNFPDVPIALIDPEPYRDALHETCKRLDGPDLKYPVESRLAWGTAAFEIVREAEDANYDLVVMGSHGRTGLGRILLGSVAEAVLRDAARPVVIVKPPKPPKVESGSAGEKSVTVF